MVNLTLQKRLAASVLKCGKRRVWMDPNDINEIHAANSRQAVRKLIKDGLVVRKSTAAPSRASHNEYLAAKAKGRHTGTGKRKGTANARLPVKVIWMRRMRVLRRMLKKYREQDKIDKHMYHELYMQVKGNRYKTKKVLMETIHKMKYERNREKVLMEQARNAKTRAESKRAKRAERQAAIARELAAEA